MIFCRKNDAQISGFSVVKEAPSLDNMFYEKKCVQLICADAIFKMVSGNFFELNGSRDIQLSVISQFREIVLFHKIIHKTEKQENSTQIFGGSHLTDHLVKFLQDGIKL